MTVVAAFEIAVVRQDVESVRDAARRIVYHDGVQSKKSSPATQRPVADRM